MSQHVDEQRRTFSYKQGQYTVSGAVVECRCGRKFLVDAVSLQPRSLPLLNGSCLECVELSEEFRRDLPALVAAIERWTGESSTEESR